MFFVFSENRLQAIACEQIAQYILLTITLTYDRDLYWTGFHLILMHNIIIFDLRRRKKFSWDPLLLQTGLDLH